MRTTEDGKMSYGFWAIGENIQIKAFVINVNTNVRYDDRELPVKQMDDKTFSNRKKVNSDVNATVGWMANGNIADLTGLPAGKYGVVVDVYYHGINRESFTSSTAFDHQPRTAESVDDVQVNDDGLYAAHLDNWSGMVFSSGKNCIVPVTGYLFSDESYVLQTASCQVDEESAVKIKPDSLNWQKDRASAQAMRSVLEDEYGITLGKKYQGGFAYAIPTKLVQQLADGRHQVNLTLTLKGPDGNLQTISLNTVIEVSKEGGTEVKKIGDFVKAYCN